MNNIDISKWKNLLLDYGTEYGLKLLGGILIWVIGTWLIKKIKRILLKAMDHLDYDETLERFLSNLIIGGLKVVLVIAILGQLGVQTTSFAAILAAAGLAIGLALQGSLSNFAGGVLIMLFKPYKIGDFIETQIEIFTTKLNTTDNKEVIIPNGTISNGNITNYSTEKTRRIDITMGVSYDADIKQTKDLLMKIMTDHPNILKEPAPIVVLGELADSSVNFKMRPWTLTADYWTVYFDVTENVKLALDAAGIEIPYPHRVFEIKGGMPQ